MNQPSVSVVIRSYNEEQHIGRLLEGILQQTLADVEIILVDSGSTDSTVAIARLDPARVISIRPEDFSFGYSLNVGCEAAQGELIAIASAHVYPVYKDWLEKLTAPFSDERVALTYGKQRGNEHSKYSEHQVFARWFPDEPDHNQKHPFCNNANAAIRRSVWEQIRYDETLTGLEDTAWAKQVIQIGYKIAYVPAAEIIHVHDETPRRIYNRYRREAIALKRIFPEERFTLIDFARLFTANLFSDYYHAARDGVLWPNLGSVFSFRLMQFWGTYRGFARRDAVTSSLRQTFYYPKGRRRTAPEDAPIEEERRIDYVRSSTEEAAGKHS